MEIASSQKFRSPQNKVERLSAAPHLNLKITFQASWAIHSTKNNVWKQTDSWCYSYRCRTLCTSISHEYAFADKSTWFVFQATLAPPATGQMFKGLLLCYSVVISTFFSAAASGYWAFGNGSAGNIFTNLAPYIPNWLVFLGNMFVIIQLVAISLVSPHKMIDFNVNSCVCVCASIHIVLINSKPIRNAQSVMLRQPQGYLWPLEHVRG